MNPPPSRTSSQTADSDLRNIASKFVAARKSAQPIDEFPGTIPSDLDTAYQIQDIAIDLWQQEVSGWKVGRIPPHLEDEVGIDRLGGPIFANTIFPAESGSALEMPMFVGGFAAIEAEYVAVLANDTPVDKSSWSLDESLDMIADLRIGMEIASSPLATINELGPYVVASDFGNNYGLVVGPSINNWRSRALDTMRSESTIDQRQVGQGGAFTLTGGFVRSVQFLLELAAQRNRPLRAGDVIATGQTTGIHDITVGQTGTSDFGDDGKLVVKMTAAQAHD